MNNPKEKAKELVDKFNRAEGDDYDFIGEPGDATMCWRMSRSLAIQCAFIACDELIINSYSNYIEDYWQQVKQEICDL
jgi:hypothetical protein